MNEVGTDKSGAASNQECLFEGQGLALTIGPDYGRPD